MATEEISAQEEAARDEELISQTLRGDPANPESQLGGDLNLRALEPGEKADNAIDFEDIGDDDLAEDEEGDNDLPSRLVVARDVPTGEVGHDSLRGASEDGIRNDTIEDLFGDVPTSPAEDLRAKQLPYGNMSFDFDDEEMFGRPIGLVQDGTSPPAELGDVESLLENKSGEELGLMDLDDPMSEEFLLQQRLFAQSRALNVNSDIPPAPPENREELLVSLWPKFRRGTVPRFMELFPPKRARYIGKTPLKVPKPVRPTKLHLDLASDQEKNFKLSAAGSKRSLENAERDHLVVIEDPELTHGGSEDDQDTETDLEDDPIGGISWQDFQVACTDWDTPELSLSADYDSSMLMSQLESSCLDGICGEDGRVALKRRKIDFSTANVLDSAQLAFPDFHNPETATAKIAKRLVLDLNDPNLLVDEQRMDTHRPTEGQRSRQGGQQMSSKELGRRYNISNDDAYEKLKQNHQNRVRNTLGNITVSHSLPAQRLQWPYYKTKLAKSEARSFHRPMAHFQKGEPITFQVPRHIKKKHLRGKDTQSIYNKTQDLSLSDNSHVLLLEYSEEYPTMLSNFGMGSRLINYYRKRHHDDTERPKMDIGELAVLLPNDTSPLTQFGEIRPGTTAPTIYNSLYKAPVFQQDTKPTDFLMVRNGTGTSGGSWYLRSIEYLRVVGQQFPTVEVPPPGGRRVTTASKNRLKMISYRLIRRRQPHRISVSEITAHVADSTDMQNRQKMKDFMVFSKEHKEWEMRPGEQIPDEDTIRGLVTPEDVCLLESMQVGQQHLEDSGLGDQVDTINEDIDEAKEGQSLEQQLAPWQTTKNFLNAAANKAMLQLHGDGDPSGRGEAFSFLKTSMKGGFRAIGESVEDRLDAKKLKELGGHSYNVQKQAESYRESIRRIWEAQTQSLSSNIEQSDEDPDLDEIEDYPRPIGRGVTPRSEAQTPSILRRRDDETTSQYSRYSTDSQRGFMLRIRRKAPDSFGNIVNQEEIVQDPRVIKKYIMLRKKREAESIDIQNIKISDDKDLAAKMLAEELARLEKNKERRLARENQKSRTANSPGSLGSSTTGSGAKAGGTQRKCANCGQIGHIKTNKKHVAPSSLA